VGQNVIDLRRRGRIGLRTGRETAFLDTIRVISENSLRVFDPAQQRSSGWCRFQQMWEFDQNGELYFEVLNKFANPLLIMTQGQHTRWLQYIFRTHSLSWQGLM
jgi:hypothetical protein